MTMIYILMAAVAIVCAMALILPLELKAYSPVLDHYVETKAKELCSSGDDLAMSYARLTALNVWMNRDDSISRIAHRFGGAAYLYYIKGYGRNVGTEV